MKKQFFYVQISSFSFQKLHFSQLNLPYEGFKDIWRKAFSEKKHFLKKV